MGFLINAIYYQQNIKNEKRNKNRIKSAFNRYYRRFRIGVTITYYNLVQPGNEHGELALDEINKLSSGESFRLYFLDNYDHELTRQQYIALKIKKNSDLGSDLLAEARVLANHVDFLLNNVESKTEGHLYKLEFRSFFKNNFFINFKKH